MTWGKDKGQKCSAYPRAKFLMGFWRHMFYMRHCIICTRSTDDPRPVGRAAQSNAHPELTLFSTMHACPAEKKTSFAVSVAPIACPTMSFVPEFNKEEVSYLRTNLGSYRRSIGREKAKLREEYARHIMSLRGDAEENNHALELYIGV